MKNKIALTMLALGLALPAANVNAQNNGPRGPRGPRGDGPGRPVPPLVAALDVNHDGTIDASELNSASESLRSLDKNTDGKLTPDELRPGRGPAPRDEAERPQTDPARKDAAPGRRPGPPIVGALDTNKDGVIDATEVANATAALKTLDKNSDGTLTMEEIGPRGPRGPRGGGPDGAGNKRRPHPPEQE